MSNTDVLKEASDLRDTIEAWRFHGGDKLTSHEIKILIDTSDIIDRLVSLLDEQRQELLITQVDLAFLFGSDMPIEAVKAIQEYKQGESIKSLWIHLARLAVDHRQSTNQDQIGSSLVDRQRQEWVKIVDPKDKSAWPESHRITQFHNTRNQHRSLGVPSGLRDSTGLQINHDGGVSHLKDWTHYMPYHPPHHRRMNKMPSKLRAICEAALAALDAESKAEGGGDE